MALLILLISIMVAHMFFDVQYPYAIAHMVWHVYKYMCSGQILLYIIEYTIVSIDWSHIGGHELELSCKVITCLDVGAVIGGAKSPIYFGFKLYYSAFQIWWHLFWPKILWKVTLPVEAPTKRSRNERVHLIFREFLVRIGVIIFET